MADEPKIAIASFNEIKYIKLRDIIRRAVANPSNVDEVARELSHDWFPMFAINSDGTYSIVVGTGTKR